MSEKKDLLFFKTQKNINKIVDELFKFTLPNGKTVLLIKNDDFNKIQNQINVILNENKNKITLLQNKKVDEYLKILTDNNKQLRLLYNNVNKNVKKSFYSFLEKLVYLQYIILFKNISSDTIINNDDQFISLFDTLGRIVDSLSNIEMNKLGISNKIKTDDVDKLQKQTNSMKINGYLKTISDILVNKNQTIDKIVNNQTLNNYNENLNKFKVLNDSNNIDDILKQQNEIIEFFDQLYNDYPSLFRDDLEFSGGSLNNDHYYNLYLKYKYNYISEKFKMFINDNSN